MRPLLQAARECRHGSRRSAFEHPEAARTLGRSLLGELLDLRDQIDRPSWLVVTSTSRRRSRGGGKEALAVARGERGGQERFMESFRKAIKTWQKSQTLTNGRRSSRGLRPPVRPARAQAPAGLRRRPSGRGAGSTSTTSCSRPATCSRQARRRSATIRRGRSTFVLVDEFQDTDPVQSEILTLARRRCASRRAALPRRRLQAVDLPASGRPSRRSSPSFASISRRGPARADRELPERAGRPRLRQRPLRRRLPRRRGPRFSPARSTFPLGRSARGRVRLGRGDGDGRRRKKPGRRRRSRKAEALAGSR